MLLSPFFIIILTTWLLLSNKLYILKLFFPLKEKDENHWLPDHLHCILTAIDN